MFKSEYNRKHILLVDDDRYLTETLALLLETRGYSVEQVHCAKEVFNSISTSVDLVLLNRILPDLDGFEVCRKLKENTATHHIPIILLSANVFSDDIVQGLHLGADDYLKKPFNHEELIARMEAVMRKVSTNNLDFFEFQVREKIICELRKILNNELIVSFFQPIYWLKPFKLFGFEILSRPQTETVLSNPELLFRAAIQFGCYVEMEILCWKKAMEYIRRQIKDEKLFFNCNPYLVEGPKYQTIKTLFDTNGIDPKRVVFEVTERASISNFKIFYEYLTRFRSGGFSIAIDDVGGGYASLESIVETKPEVVKIDRHIIKDLENDVYKRSIVKFIVGFCNENNIIAIAEGVESKKDLDIIKELGVHGGQGYFLGEPRQHVDLSEINKFVQKA